MRGESPPKEASVEYVDAGKALYPEGNESRVVSAVLDQRGREAQPEKFA